MGVQRVNWLDFKNFVITNALQSQVKSIVSGGDYIARVKDAFFTLECFLDAKHLPGAAPIGSDSEDYELNFLPFANVKRGNDSYSPDDRLRVDSAISPIVNERLASWDKKFTYDDMNFANGGVTRSTVVDALTYSTLYSYVGSGLVSGFLVTLEKLDDDWLISLEIDGNLIFGPNGISTKDMDKSSRYNFDANKEVLDPAMGFDMQKDTFRWMGMLGKPMKFDTLIEIKAKRNTGLASKKFKAGLIAIHKES